MRLFRHSPGVRTWLKRSFQEAAWAPLLVFALSMAATGLLDLYARLPWLDVPMHLAGGWAIAYFFCASIGHAQRLVGPVPRPIRLALCIGLAAVAALAWEFSEYLSDVGFGTQTNHGVGDTLFDLFLSLAGATAFALFTGVARAPRGLSSPPAGAAQR